MATNSSLFYPGGLAVDADGNVFIADTDNHRVRLETYGILVTLAGGGVAQGSNNGDGGPAYDASLGHPAGVALDSDGNLFIADTVSNRIRKVDANNNITTVAGNGSQGYSGDGEAASAASLNQPSGVVVDEGGNLYIADTANQRVRRVDVAGVITTVAGRGAPGGAGDGGAATNAYLDNPTGLALDSAGSLLIADSINNRIRKVDGHGIITTVAGSGLQGDGTLGDGGPAINASLFQPAGMAVDASGNLFIADTGDSRIRKVTPQGPGLAVAKAGIGNAGTYQVIITSSSGSVTSSVAILTVEAGPVITQQPASQSLGSGGNAKFSVAATGTPPLAYQWVFNGTNLDGQTNQSLLLPAVAAANAGLYQVLVTNRFGNGTSLAAILVVTLPQISGVTVVNGGVTLSLLTGANASSRLLAATNLAPPVVWLPVATNVPGADGVWQYTDTNSFPAIYYRTATP